MLVGLAHIRGSCSVTTAGRQAGKQAGSWEGQECCRAMPAGRDRKGMEGQGRQDWCPSAVAILLCKLWGLAVGKQ